jgi:hypothetical protein
LYIFFCNTKQIISWKNKTKNIVVYHKVNNERMDFTEDDAIWKIIDIYFRDSNVYGLGVNKSFTNRTNYFRK